MTGEGAKADIFAQENLGLREVKGGCLLSYEDFFVGVLVE